MRRERRAQVSGATFLFLGDDASSTGAVFGQLAGALWGPSAIPPSWLERLAQRELLENLADRIAR